MKLGAVLVAAAAVMVVVFFSTVWGRVDNAQHADAIRTLVAEPPVWVDASAHGRRVWEIERAFYEARGFSPAWVDGDRTTAHLEALVAELQRSAAHGLDPERYGTSVLRQTIDESHRPLVGLRFDVPSVPELDLRLTYAYLRYAADLLGGGIDPGKLRPEWRVWSSGEQFNDLPSRLEQAVTGGDVAATLAALAPVHDHYTGLQRALEGASGDQWTRIALNLERWRWAPRELGERYIVVNIPAYGLQVMEGSQEVLQMRVVVGSTEDETPVFSDLMTYLVFSPYWNIPASILRDETLPRVAKDKKYLERSGIEVLPAKGDRPLDPRSIDWSDEEITKELRFRQVPGPENALGQVKFIFPNNFAIYLHDTPAAHLFRETERAYSHGCIRVEDPVALAKYVLRDRPQWDEARIAAAMKAQEEQTVKLQTPIPVHIGYWTAWVGRDGAVTVGSDPYGIDAEHARLRGLTIGTNAPSGAQPAAPLDQQ